MSKAEMLSDFVSMLDTVIGFGSALYYLNLNDDNFYAGHIFPTRYQVDRAKQQIRIAARTSKYHEDSEVKINYRDAIMKEDDNEENGTSFEFYYKNGSIVSLADFAE